MLYSLDQTIEFTNHVLTQRGVHRKVSDRDIKDWKLEKEPRPAFTIEDIAQAVHKINKAFSESIGDHSLVAWEQTTQDIKDIVVSGVKFHIDNPDAGPDASHNNWMEQKIAQGWIYGPEKDASLKQHPSLIPYEELPLNDQIKDKLVKQTVDSLAKYL